MESASSAEPHMPSPNPTSPISSNPSGANEPSRVSVNYSQSKWEQALQRLNKEDQEQFRRIKDSSDKHRVVLDAVLTATNARKEECLRRKWKLATIKGRKIYIRDILEKLSVWVKKLIVIGDIAIQYDQAHAALPWAAVRLIMQTGINELEVFGHVIVSLENMASIVAQCHVIEAVYLGRREWDFPELSIQVTESVINLYAAILHYLADIMEYLGLGTRKRILRSIGQSQEDFQAKYSPVVHALDNFGRLTGLAQAANLEHGLDLLRNIEKQLKRKITHFDKDSELLKASIDQLRQPMNRIDTRLQEICDDLEREQRASILQAISIVPYGSHHKTSRKGRLEGSGTWFIEKPEFIKWKGCSYSSVIWLHGIPGSGKTKLTSLVIDLLLGHEHLAYFYCTRSPLEPQRAQCDKILASLVRQLASVGPNQTILPPVLTRYNDAKKRGERAEDWTTEECVEALLLLFDGYPAVTLVLDALDEVNQESRQELLGALSKLVQESTTLVRIFISSRDNYDIALHLAGTPNIYIEATDNAEDISSFIEKKLTEARLLHGNLSPSLHTDIVNTLKGGANGMFRWVDLQIQSLRPLKVAADVKIRLGKLPATLEASYWEVFQQIRESGNNAFGLAVFTFQWLLHAKKDISLTGLATLASVALGIESDSKFTRTDILDVCSNLVVGREYSFQFAHLSVREFLEGLHNRQIDTFLREEGHAALARACIGYLNQVLVPRQRAWLSTYYKTELCGRTPEIDFEGAREPDATLSDYVTSYMVDHVNEAGVLRLRPPLGDLLKAFLLQPTDSFPKWLRGCIERSHVEGMGFLVWHRRLFYRSEIELPGSPVWLACQSGWLELVKYLYQNPYDGIDKPRLVALGGRTGISTALFTIKPFWYAMATGRVDIANCIAKFTTDKAQTLSFEAISGGLLTYAIRYSALNLLKELIRQHPGGYKFAVSTFEEAAFFGPELLRLTLELSFPSREWADPNSLAKACADGHVERVESLLETTAVVEMGFRLLYLAVSFKHIELVRLLLQKQVGSSYISTALLIAVSDGDKEMADLLIQHGAKKDARTLPVAINCGLIERALYFIAAGYGGKDGASGRREQTALHAAVKNGQFKVVEALLANQPDVNALDAQGRTPLHFAVISNQANCVRALTDAGADPRVRNVTYWIKTTLDGSSHCSSNVSLFFSWQSD
ncbi:hypothetical protein GGR51DRAFT_192292 [Nemania sp. FL0031]|nr:hypothetical protein GGR51DRAFT_192292 [Nemania sp. FL0031]